LVGGEEWDPPGEESGEGIGPSPEKKEFFA